MSKVRLRYTFLILVFLLRAMAGFGQLGDRHIQLFDFSYGIQPGTILGLTKDNQGFLWILSTRAVQRFDGNEIITFKFPKGLNNILCDDKGRIWVNSTREIHLFDHVSLDFQPVSVTTQMELLSIGPIFTVPDQGIWAITTYGFLEYDEDNFLFKDLSHPIPIPPPYYASSLTTFGSCLYFGAGGQVIRYDVATGEIDSIPYHNLRRLYPVSRDTILAGLWNLESYWYDFGQHRISTADIPEEMKVMKHVPFSVRSIAHITPQHSIIGSQEGLLLYQQNLKSFHELTMFYKGKPVYPNDFSNNILYDQDGYVWFASIDGIGRFLLKGQTFGLMRNKQLHDDMPSGIDNVRQMTSDRHGSLWVATGNGFVHWDWLKNERKLYFPEYGSKTRLAYPSVRGIAYDGKYIILAPTAKGIWLFNPKTEQFIRPRYESAQIQQYTYDDFFDFLFRLNNGNIILLGRDRLYLMDGDSYEISLLDHPISKENSNNAFQGENGTVWLVTQRGMHLLDENMNYIMPFTFLTENTFVRAGFIMKDGRLLFSTNDGVYAGSFDGKNTHVEKYTSYFDDVHVNILFEDQQGLIWAATDNGIYRYDPASDRINLFDYTDNVQGFGFNFNSWHISNDGLLFLGGQNGINYFRPDGIQVFNTTLNLFIQRVTGGKRDEEIFPLDQKAVLPWQNRSLQIDFVCPFFNNPEKLKYRYRLEGSDEEWQYIGNTQTLRFPSLAPGEYTIYLEASINNTDWIPSKNHFTFRIKPPFWLSWWFFALVASGLAGMLWRYDRARNKRIQEKQEELEAEQAINYFTSRMMENQSVDELLWDVAKNCIGRLQFEDCVIYRLDEETGTLSQCAAHGPKNPEPQKIRSPIEIRLGQGIVGTVAKTGIAEIVPDTSLDPRYIVDDVRRYSEITVPIMAGDQVLGVIDSEHSKKRFFTQRHLTILSTIASLCAAKMIKAKAEADKSETEQILMATKQQMADIEMQALRAQMNPHFIFNCLNSINRYIVKSDQATASLYLTRFAKLIRLILDNSNSKTVTLTNELEALRLYIEMESIRFEKQFTYDISLGESVMPDHVYVPPLIIQPFVENAIWHGLLHKEGEGHLDIRIHLNGDHHLECTVEDNGVGRAMAKELKSKSASNTKSLGMKLTESRLALLNKQANWNAVVEVLDLVDAAGEAAGTRVTIRIPMDT